MIRVNVRPSGYRGEVRCNKIAHFRDASVIDKTHPTIPGFININVTSGNKAWKPLSPMVIGPFQVIERRLPTRDFPDGIHPGFVGVENDRSIQVGTTSSLENWWQFSKFFDVDGPVNPSQGLLPTSFLRRRAKGMQDPKPHRRALPKKQGLPVGSYFDTRTFDYIPSRKFYCTVYEDLVQRTPKYQELVSIRDRGQNIQIVGYDGFDLEPTNEAVWRAYLDPSRPFGHELVLFTMLNDLQRPWTMI